MNTLNHPAVGNAILSDRGRNRGQIFEKTYFTDLKHSNINDAQRKDCRGTKMERTKS